MDNARPGSGRHLNLAGSGIGSDDISRASYDDEQILSLDDLIQMIRRRLWIIVLVVVALVGSVAGFSIVQTPTYEATATVLIAQKYKSDASNDLNSDVEGLQSLTATFAEAVRTRPVAQGVIQRLDLSMSPGALQSNLGVQQVIDTPFILISYQDPSPERAQLIANATGEVLSERASELSPSPSNVVTAKVWEPAVVPSSPVSPDPARNILVALALALMLGLGLAFLLDRLDDSWKSPREVEQLSGVPTFGAIPTFDGSRRGESSRPRGPDPSGSSSQR